MILAEHRQQRAATAPSSHQSDGGGGGCNEEIRLGDNVASWQSSNGKKIEESAVVHRQPDNTTLKVAKSVDDEDENEDEDDEDSFTYPSSDEDEEVDENKQKWVAKRLPEIAQPSVNNQVSNSNKVNISNTNKNVYEGNVVIHQTFYSNVPNGVANPDGIDVAPMEKITDKDPEAAVGPKLSNVSSHPLYPFEKDKVTSWCTKKRLIIISGAVLVGIALIVLLVYLLTPGTKKIIPHVPSPPNDTSINNEPTFPGVRLVSRVDWLARPPTDKKPLSVPLKIVLIMQTGGVACFTQSQCANTVKKLQEVDMDDKNKTDIAHNWLVGGDGLVYTGRGWDIEGDHSKGYDDKSIGIAFIGNFEKESPTPAQIDKGEKLVRMGVDEKWIDKEYNLFGQKQCVTNSNNPGESYILGVPYVDRKKWVAQPPQSPPEKVAVYPPPYVIISHTATDFCYDRGECVRHVRFIQNFHIESQGWDDIGYNFLVGGDGAIYEGRGWDVEGAHTFNYNRKSVGISFIGTFTNKVPTDIQLFAAQKLIEYALQNGKIAEDYKLLGHRQCIKTESPGEKLYEIIKTWPHWSPKP